VLVAMSGGVDSSVVAGLLHEAGHEVIGATLQLYDHGQAARTGKTCCAGQDIMDARNVADRLGIPHYVLDREAVFRRDVIEGFADSYARGETPIPCIACNQTVKFRDLVALARDLGCEALATGHYARRVEGAAGAELHVAADAARDQSYFLAMTTRAQLDFARFPLGDFACKDEVRAEAARLGLPVAEKPDSQDICFVPSGSYAALVGKLRPEALEPGEVVHADGRVLAAHAGIARYTPGQARGLREASWDGGERLVVAAIEAPTRRVVVAPRAAAARERVVVREVNWLTEPPRGAWRASAKLRAREAPRPVRAAWDGEVLELTLEEPAVAAPGQAAVVYDGARVVAGGVIARS
jgi:tRNA-uridine 2-sulfurtransferase